MRKLKSFVLTTILGGLAVILPIVTIVMVFNWLFQKLFDLISPATGLITEYSQLSSTFASTFVIIFIVGVCFFVGFLIETRFGAWVWKHGEKLILKRIPGYGMVKETIHQFIGKNKSPFSSVALAQIFGNETRVTCFVTDEYDGGYTVFVPTGPNPTSGNIYHLKKEYVEKVDHPVEATMRSIISCGAGSKGLMEKREATR